MKLIHNEGISSFYHIAFSGAEAAGVAVRFAFALLLIPVAATVKPSAAFAD